jgi:hypothetical protein
MKRIVAALSAAIIALTASALFAADLCKGKTPGSVTFFNQEISRDQPLPAVAGELDFSGPMWALLCLPEAAGPQEAGGKKFRVVLYVKQIDIPEGKYSAYASAKQDGGVFRPSLSKPRKDIILFINEDFDLAGLKYKLDPGTYEFRLQAASEKGTGKVDVTVDWSNDVAYFQELRKAGYLADGRVKVIKQ